MNISLELITHETPEECAAYNFAITMGVLSRKKGYNYYRNWEFIGRNENGYSFQHRAHSRTKILICKRAA